MKLSTIATTAAVLVSSANAFPILSFGGLFTSKSVSPVIKATNTTISSNGTNATNSSSSAASEEALIKLISFSDEFSALYYGDDSVSLDLTTKQVYDVLGLSFPSNLTNSTQEISSIETLLNSTGILNSTQLDYEQLGDSFNETSLLDLYQAIDDDVLEYDGIVVVLDASDIEAAAFIIEILEDLVIPVVFTTSTSFGNLVPGIINLYDSILVASDSDLKDTDSGVLVVADKAIFSARYAVRSTTDTTDTVVSIEGSVGKVYESEIQWFYNSFEVPNLSGNFTLEYNDTLPTVVVLEYFEGLSSDILTALTNSGVAGLVLGAPSISDYSADVLSDIADAADSIPVVFANSEGGSVAPVELSSNSTIAAGLLTPLKAKILLQVALGSDYSIEAIHELFVSVKRSTSCLSPLMVVD